VTLAVTTVVLAFLPIPDECLEGVFLRCWASVAATAATVHLSRALTQNSAVGLSLNAGIWSGADVALTSLQLETSKALVCVLLLFPAAFVIDWRASNIVKVVASWLIAVAILAASLQFLPVTPGYLPDHLE
jgi:hypothetical protein